jgi:hypothetical protein
MIEDKSKSVADHAKEKQQEIIPQVKAEYDTTNKIAKHQDFQDIYPVKFFCKIPVAFYGGKLWCTYKRRLSSA